jgi:putative aminopeptidase FrvX
MLKRHESYEFLMEYLSTPAPSGQEVEGQKKWLDYITPFVDETFIDSYGTAVGVINPDAKYKVVLEAHADEIGWNVCYISDDGFISVNRNGGSDTMCAPSKVVDIHTRDGIVNGVFGYTAIHMRERGDEKAPKVEELFIDVGANSKEDVLGMGIDIGTKITYPDTPFMMNGDKLVGRALDNRIGGYMIAEVVRLISESQTPLDFGLYVVNSVQEEVGLHGAKMIANQIKPDMAIITDVCHDTTTPGIDKRKNGDTKIGNGPVISWAPSIHNKLREYIMQTASFNNIQYQKIASSSHSGTDTDEFAFSNGGTPSALVKIPLRYMHTTVETASVHDVEGAIKIMLETIINFDQNSDMMYF